MMAARRGGDDNADPMNINPNTISVTNVVVNMLRYQNRAPSFRKSFYCARPKQVPHSRRLVPSYYQQRQKQQRFQLTGRRSHTDKMRMGTDIHHHCDSYFHVPLVIHSMIDFKVIKLINLYRKLYDLLVEGRPVQEFELQIPASVLVHHTPYAKTLDGTVVISGSMDSLMLTSKGIVVEEIKSHDTFINEKTKFDYRTEKSYNYQVLLYVWMLRVFFEEILKPESELRQHYLLGDNADKVSVTVMAAMQPFESVQALYGAIQELVGRYANGSKTRRLRTHVCGARIIHISQNAAQRSLFCDVDSPNKVKAYTKDVVLRVKLLQSIFYTARAWQRIKGQSTQQHQQQPRAQKIFPRR